MAGKASSSEKELRARLRESVGEGFDETIGSFIQEALGATRQLRVDCPKCYLRHEVPVPDWNARSGVLRVLLDHGLGRPPSSDSTPAPPPGLDLSKWSDEQLYAALERGE
jgi:hypothetical protein